MPDKIYKVNQQKRQQLSFMYAGLMGIGILFIVDLVSETPLDISLTIALFCFSIALPFLTLLIISHYIEITREYTIWPVYMSISTWIGVLGIAAGLLAEIWHISKIAGSIFIVCCLWGMLGYFLFHAALKKANLTEAETEMNQMP